jgi:hypothetical protein
MKKAPILLLLLIVLAASRKSKARSDLDFNLIRRLTPTANFYRFDCHQLMYSTGDGYAWMRGWLAGWLGLAWLTDCSSEG